ncbi:cysteine-rich receptor-like protein kinase 26 [Chenopodium quinoa]|uniref:cysteine-rich receptor-like protein kinase 26 n=1 Tax=Chenopodium quinoa TaxID=63459 RepID=UPI000B76FB09|nr:cysteine-rich receptor-like protein kinase 26 [Chenopodium quinoa]
MAWKIIFILLLLFSITLTLIRPTTAKVNPLFLSSTCDYSKGNYTKNSPYYSNLLHTFANLSSLSAFNTFSNFTSGSGEDATNKIYALYDCRLDLTLQTCQDCVKDAGIELLQSCPSKEAIAIYAECMLRYANRPIVAMMELTPPQIICGVGVTMADEGVLNRTIKPIFKGLIEEATSENSSRYFATGEGSYFEYQKVYCLVQCTPDISRDQCKMCLIKCLELYA